MFRVDVMDQEDGNGAFCTEERLGDAVLFAVKGSQTYTLQAFVIGLVAAAVTEEVFADADDKRLREFLQHVDKPVNVIDAVKLAMSGVSNEH